MEIKLLVPLTVTVDDAHLAEILSPDWAEVFYDFEYEDEDENVAKHNVASYIARVMLVYERPLNKFDGHCAQAEDVAKCVISDDEDDWAFAADLSKDFRRDS